MKYNQKIMLKLINETRSLHDELKQIKRDTGLEKNLAVRALYHAVVAESGPYQTRYQEIEREYK
ncbi:MAG: hypothetical protein KIG60_08995 [Caryophanon sp.]|nr:hypothetical protein [Caryophanon sp.]